MMAHECPECGHTCHCGGDIDDLTLPLEAGTVCTCCAEELKMWVSQDWGPNDPEYDQDGA